MKNTTPSTIPTRIPMPSPAALAAVPDLSLPPEIERLLDCLERVAECWVPGTPGDAELLAELGAARERAQAILL